MDSLVLLNPRKTTDLRDVRELSPSACSFLTNHGIIVYLLRNSWGTSPMNKISGTGVFTSKDCYQMGKVFKWSRRWMRISHLPPQTGSQVASFSMGFAPQPRAVWKSGYQFGTVKMIAASAGYGAADSCTYPMQLSHYISLLLKPFYWLAVMQRIYFKVCGPHTAWNGFTCTLNTVQTKCRDIFLSSPLFSASFFFFWLLTAQLVAIINCRGKCFLGFPRASTP